MLEELEDRTLPSGVLPYVQSIDRTMPAGPGTNVSTVNLAFSGLPATATVHSSITFTLTALAPSNNPAAGYTGTVHFSTTDNGAGSVVPADYIFVPADGGVHVFTGGATLVSPGIQTITAYDTVAIVGNASAALSVIPAAASHFAVNYSAPVLPNTAFSFTVTAQDQFGNTATAYAGTVDFSSSDSQALLPINTTLTDGVGNFSATLGSGGKQTITATDSTDAAITGSTVINAVNSSGIAPFVQSINRTAPAGPVTNASTVTFTVTFSQAVTGVNLSDFALALSGTATGSSTQVTAVNGAVYTVAVSGITGEGDWG